MYCTQCGSELVINAAFCTSCGAPVGQKGLAARTEEAKAKKGKASPMAAVIVAALAPVLVAIALLATGVIGDGWGSLPFSFGGAVNPASASASADATMEGAPSGGGAVEESADSEDSVGSADPADSEDSVGSADPADSEDSVGSVDSTGSAGSATAAPASELEAESVRTTSPAVLQEAEEPHANKSDGIKTSPTEPFYGVWVSASKDYEEALSMARELESAGLSSYVFMTTDWSNLNPEPWYVISAGRARTDSEARSLCDRVQAAGYDDAYVKYSGDYIGAR